MKKRSTVKVYSYQVKKYGQSPKFLPPAPRFHTAKVSDIKVCPMAMEIVFFFMLLQSLHSKQLFNERFLLLTI